MIDSGFFTDISIVELVIQDDGLHESCEKVMWRPSGVNHMSDYERVT
jgi:hypothetical protein